ncbi:AAA family ATPase [Streptomyces sp. NPDC101151]|uniref:AAA family ATPase n=1 Tax=Streptomyces sp. NPDC101151 TaxID=3366115 RepID=UPI0037FCEA3B
MSAVPYRGPHSSPGSHFRVYRYKGGTGCGVERRLSLSNTDSAFVGRGPQMEQLQACACAVRTGVPWVVAVTGEAGIGKTALIRRLTDGLTGFDVLWASCDATEQDYACGVLGQLARRLASGSPAKAALDAEGVLADTAPVALGSALVTALTAAQEQGPVAVVVDDAQWADAASMAALGFVARRMWRERILIALTARSDAGALTDPASATTEPRWQRMAAASEHSLLIPLTGMGESEIAQLAQAVGAGPLSAAAAGRLRAHTSGNPLYLHSLFTEVSGRDLADLHQPLPAPQSLAAAIRCGLDHLAPDSRRLIEALAILGTQVPLPVAAQIAGVADPTKALGQALGTGLVQWRPSEPSTPLRIMHVVQQQVIVQAIPPSRRAALHAAAASQVDADAAWGHRVAAAERVDARLAAELEAEADRLRAGGQLSRAATLLLWAADLSDSRQQYDRRLLTGAVRALLAGDHARCLGLAEAVESCEASAARSCVLGGIAYAQGDLFKAQPLLAEAIEAAQAQGAGEVAALACALLGAAYSRQHRTDAALPLLLRAAGLDLPEPRAVNYARHLLALATQSLVSSPARPGTAHPAGTAHGPVGLAASLLLNPRGLLSEMADELHTGTDDLSTLVRRQRVGEVGDVLVPEYFMLAAFQYLAGAWDDAAVTARKSLTVAASSGQLFEFAAGRAIASMAAATQGRWEAADEHLHSCERAAGRTGVPLDLLYPVMARVVLAQARGDATAMSQALTSLPSLSSAWHGWWLPLQVEAYTGAQRLNEAADALARLEALAEEVPGLKVTAGWLAGELHQARGQADSALYTYQSTLHLPPEPDEIPLHRARLEHAYGRMLLAQDRPAALQHLGRARSRYLAAGAPPFATRATEESRDHSLEQGVEPALDGVSATLTRREADVAGLAAEGMTNKEVADELCISAKTVEYHLGHVFTKLGLTSRRQLRAALAVRRPARPGTPLDPGH